MNQYSNKNIHAALDIGRPIDRMCYTYIHLSNIQSMMLFNDLFSVYLNSHSLNIPSLICGFIDFPPSKTKKRKCVLRRKEPITHFNLISLSIHLFLKKGESNTLPIFLWMFYIHKY